MTAYTATERRSHLLAGASHGGAYNVINLTATIELAVSTLGSTFTIGYVPSNARLLGSSRLYSDTLGGSSTLDLGIGAVKGNLVNADDPNGLSAGHDVSSALSDALVVAAADMGKPAWDFVASETVDPGGMVRVYGTVTGASTTVIGTITTEMNYVVD